MYISYLLLHIFLVPCDENMKIIFDVFLIFSEILLITVTLLHNKLISLISVKLYNYWSNFLCCQTSVILKYFYLWIPGPLYCDHCDQFYIQLHCWVLYGNAEFTQHLVLHIYKSSQSNAFFIQNIFPIVVSFRDDIL